MGRQCEVSGKKTSFGNHKTERGKAKYLGGVGTKTTGISPHLAVYKALIALACPGPPVTSTTPTLPVMRAQASAM